MTDTPFYCSEHSLLVGEQLYGTAPHVETALILEFNGRWEPEILDGESVPGTMRGWLRMHQQNLPNVKVWFIRRNKDAPPRPEIMFFVAQIRETNPALFAFPLTSYDALLDVDIAALIADETAFAAYRSNTPLVLTCTHGRRDRCCARFGLPAYEQLTQALGESVWQSSHLGGHRFAANMVILPHGIYYGRVAVDDEFVAAIRAGQIVSEAYRGRACYPKPIQAAEYFLRRETGITDLAAFTLEEANANTNGQWRVQFTETGTAARHMIHLQAEDSEFRSYMNSDDSEPETVTQYALLEHTTAR